MTFLGLSSWTRKIHFPSPGVESFKSAWIAVDLRAAIALLRWFRPEVGGGVEDTSDSTFVVILNNVFSKDLILDREHRLVQVGVNLESVELFCLVVLAA